MTFKLKNTVEHAKIPFALSLSKGGRDFGMLPKWLPRAQTGFFRINPSLILLLIFALPAQAKIYKWIDADGKSHFSGSKPDHPASIENRNELEAKSPQPAQPAAAPRVDIYVTSWCPYCKKAMAYLRKNNIAFTAYDIDKDPMPPPARKR